MEEVKEVAVEETAVQTDALAELASQHGWDPAKGDKGPKEFIEYALTNLEPRGKELKELKQELTYVRSHIEEQKQLAYQQALRDVEERKRLAVESGDLKAIDAIYEEKQKLTPPAVHDVANDFLRRYNNVQSDPALEAFEIRKFISERDDDLAKRNLDPETHIKILESDMLKKFPDYFGKSKVSATVSKDSNSQADLSVKKNFSYRDLTSQQKEIADRLKNGGHSIDDYIKGLVEQGTLK